MDSCGEEQSGYIASCPSSGVASHLSVSFVIITKGEKFGFCPPSQDSAALPPAQPALTRWARGGPSRGSLWGRSCHWYTSPWLGPPAEGSCSPSSGLPRINGPFPPCGLSHLAPLPFLLILHGSAASSQLCPCSLFSLPFIIPPVDPNWNSPFCPPFLKISTFSVTQASVWFNCFKNP